MSVSFKVICPRRVVTGGTEAAHQLAHALQAAGQHVEIVYFPIRRDNVTPDKFKPYGLSQSRDLPDRADVVVVVPEVLTRFVWKFRRAQVLIWWLSVDNHFIAQRPTKWTKRAKLWLRTRLPSQREYAFQPRANVHHAWQSEYARRFLVARGVAQPLPLTDYIAPQLIPAEAEIQVQGRRDQVLYNPAKGRAFTEALREACRSEAFEFVPLQGYTAAQMRELLGQAKVYIDFGEHPGRDRIPREAAACGCVVITGRRGSAGNDIDVPLPDRYKIDDAAADAVQQVRDLLRAVMADAPAHMAAQRGLREGIRGQQAAFMAEAAAIGRHFAARHPSR